MRSGRCAAIFLRNLLPSLLIATALAWPATAALAQDACSSGDAHEIFEAVKDAPAAASVVSPAKMLAADDVNSVVLAFPQDKLPADGSYRVLIKEVYTQKSPALIIQVVSKTVGEDAELAKKVQMPAKSPEITFDLPAGTAGWWELNRIFVIHCPSKAIASADFRISPRASSAWAIVIITVVIYVALAAAARLIFRKPQSFWRCLDPVVLTAGSNGKGSLSKLQIAFFSLLVFAMLSYIYARTGVLSDLSPTILVLLGISAVGAAGSKATDLSRNRLAFANWIWMVRKHWLPPGGLAAVNQARWRDLIASDGEFDVYHMQMLIFSLVVGVSLLAIGLTDLASFDVPQNLLGVLGLSQVVYLGGKLVTPPSCAELDKAITELRKLEEVFRTKATELNRGPPPNLANARTLAPAEYAAFKHAVGPTKGMADEVLNYDRLPGAPAPVLEPEYA